MEGVYYAEKENVPPQGSPARPSRKGNKALRFSDVNRYHPYQTSSDACSSDEVTSECLPLPPRAQLRFDSSDPAFLLPKRRRGILKANSYPINVVDSGDAEEGKQRNAPRRHSLPVHDVPLDAIAKALAMQGGQSSPAEMEALVDALETLEASLENETNTSSEPKGENDNCSPRNLPAVRRPPSPPNSSSPSSKGGRAPIGLRDIEAAYARICTQLRRGEGNPQILPILRRTQRTLVRCLTRELDNVLNPQLSALESNSSALQPAGPLHTPAQNGKRKKQGRSEADVRRRKVELEVCQAALKTIGLLSQSASLRECMPAGVFVAFLELITRMPNLPTLKLAGDREVLAFAAWVMGAQGLPTEELGDTIGRMAMALTAILAAPAKANDKTRRIVSETLTAVEHLVANHPDVFLAHCKHYLVHLFRFTASAWAPLRDAATLALGRVALHGANSPFSAEIAGHFFEWYHRQSADGRTQLADLSNKLSNAQAEENMVQAPWILTEVALMPALASDRFRVLEEGGPKVWMANVQWLLHRPTPELKELARFVWNHLIYCWMRHSEDSYVPSKPNKVWATSTKAFELVTQIINYDISETRAAQKPHRARTIMALLYAFSGFFSQPEHAKASHDHLPRIFDSLARPHLSALMLNPSEPSIREAAWRALAAICGAPDELVRSYDPSRLLCRPLLAGAAMRFSNNMQAVLEQAISETIQPAEIAAWNTTWLLENAGAVLPLITTAFRSAMVSEEAVSELPHPLAMLWRHFLEGLVSAWRQESMNLLNAAVTAAQQVFAVVSLLQPLPFFGQLAAIATEALADVPVHANATAPSAIVALPIDSLSKGDFVLLLRDADEAGAKGRGAVQLWLTLAPTWLASVRAIEGAIEETQLASLVSFALLPFCSTAAAFGVPSAAFESVELLIAVDPRARDLVVARLDSLGTSSPPELLAQIWTTVLSAQPDSLVAGGLARHAVGRYAASSSPRAEVLDALLTSVLPPVERIQDQASTVQLVELLLPAIGASHAVSLEARAILYDAVLLRALAVCEPTQQLVAALEPWMVAPFRLAAQCPVPLHDFAVALEACWEQLCATGIEASIIQDVDLEGLLIAIEAEGISQFSKASTIDSQSTEETQKTESFHREEHSNAYDADVDVSSRMDVPESPQLGTTPPPSQPPTILIDDLGVTPSSPETPTKKKRQIEFSSDEELTEEKALESARKRARRAADRSPQNVSVVIRDSSSPSRTALRGSLSAPSSREPSPVSRESTPGVNSFLEKMRTVWEERADNEQRERLEAMDADMIHRLLTGSPPRRSVQ